MKANRVLVFFGLLLAGFAPSGAAQSQTVGIVALGDSNTAGFGVGTASAFPAILEAGLRADGYDVRIANAGISGDTTSGMLARLDAAVPAGTRIAIVQGGYNDRSRGIAPADSAANIDAILANLQARRVKAVLCGLSDASWSAIARRRGATFIAGSTCYDVNSRGFDGLHMNAEGHRIVAGRLAPTVKRLLPRS